MNKKRLVRIRHAANELINLAEVEMPPVPVKQIAKLCNVHLRFEPADEDIAGIFLHDEGQTIIGVNTNHHPNRQRFTIAHELGHMKLHFGSEPHIDRTLPAYHRDVLSSSGTEITEIEANAFAAELLMPKHMIEKDWDGQKVVDYESDPFINDLAKQYEVSLQAMIFRLINLGLITP